MKKFKKFLATCLIMLLNFTILPMGKANAATITGQSVVTEARKYLGRPYVYGATGPNSFDCSGFTQYVYKQLGYTLDRTTYDQINNGKSVSRSDLQPGDLVFTSTQHVGIYIGGGQMIHAPKTGDVVKISDIWAFYAARRIISYKTGWVLSDNQWYYVLPDGNNQKGWFSNNGNKYYMDNNGVMKTGWVQLENNWYYLDKSGAMKTGWVQLGGNWYYLDKSGAMKTGWVQLGDNWYYLDKSGAMKTGWVQLGNNWYYLDKSGAMKTGWIQLGNNWYYLDKSGAMKTGWIQLGNNWYYLDKSGAMKTGWVQLGNNWYYLDNSGAMKTGWVQLKDGKTYYFYSDGHMAVNKTIDGRVLGSDGVRKQ